MRRAYGHRAKCTACGQQARAWSSCLRALSERGADGALGDAILEVGIDATEGELMSRVVAGLPEGVVVEASVVAMIMLDSYAVLGGKGLESMLGSESLRG